MTNKTTQRTYTEAEVVELMQTYRTVKEIGTARATINSQGLDPEDTEMPITKDVYNLWVSRIPENIRSKLELKLL